MALKSRDKVYLVMHSGDECYSFLGIFSSLELAVQELSNTPVKCMPGCTMWDEPKEFLINVPKE